LILMLTSKGMAGIPRASLVVIAATLNQFNIPEESLETWYTIEAETSNSKSSVP
ncbi:MAG: cation:dicarboxylate symporter family transporter, partial [Arsenophonus sp. NC-LC2-MAG3]